MKDSPEPVPMLWSEAFCSALLSCMLGRLTSWGIGTGFWVAFALRPPLVTRTSCAQDAVVEVTAASRGQEDDDVVAERARIDDGRADRDRVQLRHLRKVYTTQPPKVHTPVHACRDLACVWVGP